MKEKYLTLYLDEYGDFATEKKFPNLNRYICGRGLRRVFNISEKAEKIYLSVSERKKPEYVALVYDDSQFLTRPDGGYEFLTSAMLKVFVRTFELSLPFRGNKTFYVACWEEC